MTGIEDLRQVARIARAEGRALDTLIRRHACYRKTSGIGAVSLPGLDYNRLQPIPGAEYR